MARIYTPTLVESVPFKKGRKTSMREDPFQSGVDRWDWYARGDASVFRRAARGSDASGDDNSSERVLWESGLVIVVPLACAALVEVAMRMAGS
jgi:hypothetical protein